ncbi:glycoside hydrolase family 3 N-terminal domain-containing protein [Klugiella sp. YN-L-19]|uniref:beta-N-acetylhexosaminidase n=1 Tax=Ruicaihuangia caeni TaxID=3042517 RepID=A0AAW6T9S8_9MICO|nr:glycoside hydrolase family 3 N-terminal domain-containing protein [Klugiella sp. YN-L-19]
MPVARRPRTVWPVSSIAVMLTALVLGGCTPAHDADVTRASNGSDTEHHGLLPVPEPAHGPAPPAADFARQAVDRMTISEKVGAVLMLHLPGTDQTALAHFVEANELSGVILMGDNMPEPSIDGLQTVTSGLADDDLPPLVAIDQEGGVVERVRPDPGKPARELASLPPEATEESFRARAELLRSLGVNVNFGIVADVTDDPSSFIRSRVLGAEPTAASDRVARAVAGEQGRVRSTLKHFPGHGVAAGDSHSSIPSTGITLDQWRDSAAKPFAAGIDAGAELVMMGHLRFDAIDPAPASMSARWHEVLREELGFDGVIVSDDLNMLPASGAPEFADAVTNAVNSLNAGTDLLLFVGGVEPQTLRQGLIAAAETGAIDGRRLDEAAERVLALRRGLAASDGVLVHCDASCRRAIG